MAVQILGDQLQRVTDWRENRGPYRRRFIPYGEMTETERAAVRAKARQSQRNKCAFVVRESVIALVKKSLVDGDHPIFMTLTFKENVTDKAEARVRWRAFRERLKRKFPTVRAVGCWQRQRRGAWHLHLVCSCVLGVHAVRSMALATGWGTFVDLKLIQGISEARGYRSGVSTATAVGVANYITRYITRDLDTAEQGEHLTVYVEAKVGTQAFQWVRGMARLVRLGRSYVRDCVAQAVIDGTVKFGAAALSDLTRGELARLGWETLDGDQQRVLLFGTLNTLPDGGVRAWYTVNFGGLTEDDKVDLDVENCPF